MLSALRQLCFPLLIMAAVFTTASVSPSNTWAQDDADAEFGAAEAVAEPAAPAAPAADAEAAANPAAKADGGAGAAASAESENLLLWFCRSLGWRYVVVFFFLSVTLVSLFVMNMLSARRDTLCPQELVDNFEEKLNAKDFQGAYDMARTDESVLGQVLSAGLAKLSRGYSKAIEGMQEVGEEESMKIDHRLSYMALIGNLAPMIGLFGTVEGMIQSFQVIAASEASPKPSELAGGISTALFTTLVGLAVAIPAIAAYNILKNRVSRLLLEVGVTSENLMSRFEDQGGKK
jgi:biopolymer transport protein ExbB